MKKVIHMMRKFLPPTASFIYNQIRCHQHFEPSLVYCEKTASVFLGELDRKYTSYQAVQTRFGRQLYRFTRTIPQAEQKRLLKHIQQVKPDMIHVHYGVDALVYADVFRHLSMPVLVSFYGYDCTSFPRRFKGFGKLWLQKKLFENPHITAYTAMSPDMKKDLLMLGCPEEKIKVHYHGSDPVPFHQKRNYQDKEDVHLLIISSLTAKKGHFFLLKALKRAQQQTRKKLHLHIVGEGELKDKLAQFIQSEQLQHVYLHGQVDYGSERHHRFLEEADIFVHPSVHTPQGEKEGIPGALIESRSSGLPVIATYHAGIPYIVEHGKTGLLIHENDIAGLAACMVKLAESVQLRERIGKAGQAYTLNKLDVRQKERDLEEIYEGLIKKKAHSPDLKNDKKLLKLGANS